MSGERLFEGQAVVVVGGGLGLGRQYCLDLAAEGGRVLVAGRSANVQSVVEEIAAAGGIASACIADARDGERVIASAIENFGRIDGLIVNAGILRDHSFGKMTEEAWAEVVDVHLGGTFACVRAAWPHMMQQRSGRIVLTATSGVCYGNFGQANYIAAKGAIVSLARTLALEGAARNVHVNAIAPIAHTRLTEGVFDEELAAALRIEDVSPFVLALVHPRSSETGSFLEIGGGWAGKLRWQCSGGRRFEPAERTAANILAHWRDIVAFDDRATLRETSLDSLGTCAGPEIDARLRSESAPS